MPATPVKFWSGVKEGHRCDELLALSIANHAINKLSQLDIRRISCRSSVYRRDAAIPVQKRADLQLIFSE
jgi:hypothetical protein